MITGNLQQEQTSKYNGAAEQLAHQTFSVPCLKLLGWSHMPSAAISPQDGLEQVRQLWAAVSCFCGGPCECLHSRESNSSQQELPGDPAGVCLCPGSGVLLCAGVVVLPLCHWCCHTEGAQAPGGQCPLPTVKRPRNQPQTTECLQ